MDTQTNSEPSKPRKTRVHWKPDEHAALAYRAQQLLDEGEVDSDRSALLRAQLDVLPEDRRRDIKAITSEQAWWPKACAAARKRLRAEEAARQAAAKQAAKARQLSELEAREQTEPPPLNGHAAAPQPSHEEAAPRDDGAEIGAMVQHLHDHLVETAAVFLEQLLVKTVQRLLTSPEVASLVQSLYNRVLPDLAVEHRPGRPHDPRPVQEVKSGVPVVLVCGMKPATYAGLQSRFNGRLALRFYYDNGGSVGSIAMLQGKARAAQCVLFSMEATGHHQTAAVDSLGKRILRVTGGTSSMVEALERLCTEFAAQRTGAVH